MNQPSQPAPLPHGPLVQAVAIQLLVLVLLCGVLDGGVLLHASILACLPFWLCVVRLRLRQAATWGLPARLFIRWGLLAFLLMGMPALVPLMRLLRRLLAY